ncbi:MAG: hypothetical protein IPH11_01910 [Ignavibacteriales bacterium]|nr:hypothetical protein [Ignavibacteriales bacterium]
MKNICVVIVLALVFVVDYGAVAIAQEEHQHHNKKILPLIKQRKTRYQLHAM